MSDSQQVDLSQQASVTLPLFQWNAVLGLLRTGRGDAFTWENTNPLILRINQQLEQQMFGQSRPSIGVRPNGEDHEERAQDRKDDARVQRRRPPLWEQDRTESE